MVLCKCVNERVLLVPHLRVTNRFTVILDVFNGFLMVFGCFHGLSEKIKNPYKSRKCRFFEEGACFERKGVFIYGHGVDLKRRVTAGLGIYTAVYIYIGGLI